MFGKTTFISLPDEILNSQDDGLAYYLADIWHKFFQHCGLRCQDTIVEVAPGCSGKIGLALEKSEFSGTLYVIEPLNSAMEVILEKYRRYLPKSIIHPMACTVTEALASLPRGPDFLVANHPLDDMLLSAISKQSPSDLYHYASTSHRDCRAALGADPRQYIAEVVHCWQHVVDRLQPKITILSQYPSLTLKQNGLHFLNNCATEVLEELKRHYFTHLDASEGVQRLLNGHENYNDFHLGTEVLNAKNWMLLYNTPPQLDVRT